MNGLAIKPRVIYQDTTTSPPPPLPIHFIIRFRVHLDKEDRFPTKTSSTIVEGGDVTILSPFW